MEDSAGEKVIIAVRSAALLLAGVKEIKLFKSAEAGIRPYSILMFIISLKRLHFLKEVNNSSTYISLKTGERLYIILFFSLIIIGEKTSL